MSTEILDLPDMTEAQGGKTILYNENNRRLEAVLIRVLSRASAVPGVPANGDTYIVLAGNTGEWASANINDIAHYYNDQWDFYAPVEGMRLWVNDEDKEYVFNNAIWVVNSGIDTSGDTVFTGNLLAVDANAGSAQLRAKAPATETATCRIEGDSTFDSARLEFFDTFSSNGWRVRQIGSSAGLRNDYLVIQYSPNSFANNHEAIRLVPNQATNNNDPTEVEFPGGVTQLRDQRFVQESNFVLDGDARSTRVMYRGQTTTATPTEIFIDGASERFAIANDTSLLVIAKVLARRTDAPGETAAFQLEGLATRDGGSTTFVAAKEVKFNQVGVSDSWVAELGHDDAFASFILTVTGQAAKTIRWVASIEFVTITG